MRRPPRSPLFPYTTLFRSRGGRPDVPRLRTDGRLPEPYPRAQPARGRSEEHTSELQSLRQLVCRLLFERCGDHQDLHSFPTRRSSDLVVGGLTFPVSGQTAVYQNHTHVLSPRVGDRKSTRLNSSHLGSSYVVFCLKDAATTKISTLSLHDALPISWWAA